MSLGHLNELTGAVIGVAIDVHRQLGPLLEEPLYEEALAAGLTAKGFAIQTQQGLPLTYKGVRLDCGYRLDILVERVLPLELKAVEAVLPVHEAQLLTYLRLGHFPLGLLVNFDVELLKDGIRRLIETRGQAPQQSTLAEIDPARSLDPVSAAIIVAAIEVHRVLGPGLLASSYRECLCYELSQLGMPFEKSKPLQLRFNASSLRRPVEVPLVVADQVPVFLLSADVLSPLHRVSMLALLRQFGWSQGLILNFNSMTMREGIQRVVN